MKSIKGSVAVVTGAASGIGRELAIQLAALGCHLALSDLNEEELVQTAALLTNSEIKVKTDKLNVADQVAFFAYADDVMAHFGQVDIVINNAGRSVADSFLDGSIEDFKMIMDINFWGAFYGSKAFLPHLLKRPSANLANVSSVNALIPFPNQSSYNTSKYAIAGLTETLQQEMRGTSVKVMVIYPGGVRTNIVKNGKFIKGPKEDMTQEESAKYFERVAMTSVTRAARLIIKGIRKDRSRLRIGPDSFVFDYLKRLFPRFAVKIVAIAAKM
jgi:short-subunit dehydrogenase